MSKYDGHTPGPWEWYSSNSHIRLGTSKSYNEILYAEGHKDGVGSILLSNLVDGRLIADAPDLLAENEQLEAQLAEARATKAVLVEALNSIIDDYEFCSRDASSYGDRSPEYVKTARQALTKSRR